MTNKISLKSRVKQKIKNRVLESDDLIGIILFTLFFIAKYGFKKGLSMGLDYKWFDWYYGTQTETTETGDKDYVVDIVTDNLSFAVESTADKVTRFRRAMKEIKKDCGFDPKQATLVDFGSGKGRVLILAHKYGFKKILGVELSSSMIKICKQNLEITDCTKVEVKECDAVSVVLEPETPVCIFYLYNPFSEHVLEPVVNNIVQSACADSSLLAYLVYSNPVHSEVMDDHQHVNAIYSSATEKIKIYKIDNKLPLIGAEGQQQCG